MNPNIRRAIDTSIREQSIAALYYEPTHATELRALCDEYLDNEYWGTDEDGDAWHVMLVPSVRRRECSRCGEQNVHAYGRDDEGDALTQCGTCGHIEVAS